MNVEFLFRRLVYAQVLLGVVAFCIAEQNPRMLLMAGTLGALSWYVSEGPTGRPLPQWLINLGATLAVLWLGVEMFLQDGRVIIAMGHFTIWLQVLQLYGHKSNREYGLILVLSMLQMVGASVLSVTIIFGVLLLAYCVLCLVTILVFQIKATADEVKQAGAMAGGPHRTRRPPPAVVGRGHRRHFRITAALIAVSCGVTAAAVFVLLPRTSRFDDARVGVYAQRQVGFSNQVQLGGPPPEQGAATTVMSVKASQRLPFLLLRGAPLDEYDPRTRTWRRGNGLSAFGDDHSLDRGPKQLFEPDTQGGVVEAEITIRDMAHPTLFSLYPTCEISSPSLSRVVVNRVDQQIEAPAPPGHVLIYTIRAPLNHAGRLPDAVTPRRRRGRFESLFGRESVRGDNDYAREWYVEREVVRDYALAVLREHYDDPSLDRNPYFAHDARDAEFARVLERHLQQNFAYSLTNVPRGSRDPIVEFLLNDRTGHCELFASAHAALLRSLGVRARVVTGYRASEYNAIGDYYVVRQRNAHAWTEVDCGALGWRTFDATPPADVAAAHLAGDDWLAGPRQLYEYVEFLWIDAFVAYDKETRQKLMTGVKEKVRSAADDPDTWLGAVVQWLRRLEQRWRFDQLNVALMAVIIVLIVVCLVSLMRMRVSWRRRTAGLQLRSLPRRRRRTVLRDLAFYLHMTRLLERHGHRRPMWQCPRAFAESLNQQHPGRFDSVGALTRLFYEVRFGGYRMDEARGAEARRGLHELEAALSPQAAGDG